MMGLFQISLFKKGVLISAATNNNINPNSNGSVGINKPKLWVNSSMFTESGVKKASEINTFSV